MASPQVENGFTRIANELLDELIKADLTGTRLRIMLAVIRETYGWQRRSVTMGYQAFCTEYGFARTLLIREMQWLVDHKYLLVKAGNSKTSPNTWTVQKDYSQWLPTSHSGVTSDAGVTSHQQVSSASHLGVSSASHSQVTTPKKDKERKESGGVAPPSTDAAAAVDPSLVSRLMDEQMLMRDQATKAAALDCMTPDVLDQLKAWRQTMIERNTHLPQQKQKKPQAILWFYLKQGLLPDDLPAAAAPEPEPVEQVTWDEVTGRPIVPESLKRRLQADAKKTHLYHRG